MEHPSEYEIQAMSNREFAELIRWQADQIDRLVNRESRPSGVALAPDENWV